ncbi:serine/threonine-protein kinase [Armatimonas sp.]|uniref:serine/threonine-protein kinase n=1 Tax=Armatimonas sp. TaxID=1872638 RepID=UPI00286AAE3E|nr:serine/threonine-protein kinase [Armatimonas sp.]
MQLGRYKIVREIARSNDIVYEAQDPQVGRRVAVKELALAPDAAGAARVDRIERFYREARAAGQLSHPNIVTIHEVGEDAGRYFIAMEYLEGQTLRQQLVANGPLPLTEVVRIGIALADALDFAHRAGIVHRDLKPDNVHILPGGQVKLTDFGIARILSESALTVAGQIFGTPSYMSPEQIKGLPIDARSDIFSLGILLWEMTAGRKPFTGDSVVTITYHICNDPTPPVPGATPALEAVIQRATQKDASGRFYSAHELREALEAVAQSRTGVFAAANRMQAPPARMSGGAFPAPISAADFGGGGGNSTMQYGAATQLGMAPPAPPPPHTASPNLGGGGGQGLAPIPVQTRGSYAWLWGALGGAALVIIGFLLATTITMRGRQGTDNSQTLPQGGEREGAPKAPLDQFIDQAISKKLGSAPPSGGASGSAPSVVPQVRQASEQELTLARRWIEQGKQYERQRDWNKAADCYRWAKEKAINTEVGNEAERLYSEAVNHTDLFGGAIRREN